MFKHINYSRAAFLHPLNIGVLLGAFLTVFVLSDSGLLANVIFSFILGLELIYLGVAPHLPQFHEHVRKRRGGDHGRKAGEMTILEMLSQDGRDRFLSLKNQIGSIREEFERLPYSAQPLIDRIGDNLDRLVKKYMQMLELYDRYEAHLQKTDEEELNEKISEEKKKIRETSSEKLVQGRKRRLQVLQNRLEKRKLTKEKNTVCTSALETIEDTIRYIDERVITMSDSKLDDLLSELVETSNTVEDLFSTFKDIGEPEVERDIKNGEESTCDKDEGKSQSTR